VVPPNFTNILALATSPITTQIIEGSFRDNGPDFQLEIPRLHLLETFGRAAQRGVSDVGALVYTIHQLSRAVPSY